MHVTAAHNEVRIQEKAPRHHLATCEGDVPRMTMAAAARPEKVAMWIPADKVCLVLYEISSL